MPANNWWWNNFGCWYTMPGFTAYQQRRKKEEAGKRKKSLSTIWTRNGMTFMSRLSSFEILRLLRPDESNTQSSPLWRPRKDEYSVALMYSYQFGVFAFARRPLHTGDFVIARHLLHTGDFVIARYLLYTGDFVFARRRNKSGSLYSSVSRSNLKLVFAKYLLMTIRSSTKKNQGIKPWFFHFLILRRCWYEVLISQPCLPTTDDEITSVVGTLCQALLHTNNGVKRRKPEKERNPYQQYEPGMEWPLWAG